MKNSKVEKKSAPKREPFIITPLTVSQPLGKYTLGFIAVLFFLLSFLFYGNTLLNDYALDDAIVINNNDFTKKGIAGIPDILTSDSFAGWLKKDLKLIAGGRYRPLPQITFAIEYEIIGGENPLISHAINVILYAACVISIFFFLVRYCLPLPIAFLAALFFLIHPIHTEVVANIKGRDEILPLLLSTLSLFTLFKGLEKTNLAYRFSYWVGSFILFFLSLLSKENAITFLAIIPITFFCFTRAKIKEVILLTLPYLVLVSIYLIIRYNIVGLGGEQIVDVINNSYSKATTSQKYATIFYVFTHYLHLLILPHPLAWDYSYQEIPYKELYYPSVIFSFILHFGFPLLGLKYLYHKNPIGWSILFFYASISIVSNIFINIGGFMAERLVFQGSLGFVTTIAIIFYYYYCRLSNILRAPTLKVISYVGLGIMIWLCWYKTFERNKDWYNSETLVARDVQVTNSAMIFKSRAQTFLNKADAEKDSLKRREYQRQAIPYLKRAVEIYPEFYNPLLNLGKMYYVLGDTVNAEKYWDRAYRINPHDTDIVKYTEILGQVYYKRAERAFFKGNIDSAFYNLQKTVYFDPKYATAWSNLGFCYNLKGQYDKAIEAYLHATRLEPKMVDYWYYLGAIYFNTGRLLQAQEAWRKVVELMPNHPQANAGLQSIQQALQKQNQ
ncbi:MAG: tetratricopeptide repeat protein [Bacteroidia bacterium]|nr:tetratricopeptide repeat protein [Bacteroidia bacterium]